MTELATAWITIVPETSGIPRSVRSALGQAERDADRSGRNMGNRMSSALGGAFKTGATAAAAAGTAAIGTALVKGFQRLDAIDQAKGKLTALGASTQTTARVMDSALAAVKGTSYGLGDAATIASSAMAAGVKPGKDLTGYLSMTADAAAIAGTSLGEMGSILNQVQTGQKAQTDDLNQLADRGIPIYQWLAQEAGVAAGEVKEMAADGAISSEMFFRAIQKNVGGAAKTIGSSTVRGGFENLKAAMGRIGAAALEPSFNRLPGAFTSLTGRIDELTPKAKELAASIDTKIFDEWGPKIREALKSFEETGSIDEAKQVFEGLWRAMQDGAGPAREIAQSLAQASATLGVSGWQLLLTVLRAGTTVLNVLNPLLSSTADLMQSNQGAVTALVAAWLAFKTIPAIVGRVTTALAPMNTGVRSATTGLMGLARANNAVVQAGSFGAVTMGRFGSQIAMLGQRMPVIARMQSSFVGAAAGANRFGRTAGIAAAAGTGLRAAGAGIAGVFGGPVGLALTGAVIAGTAWASTVAEQKQLTEQYTSSLKDLANAQDQTQLQLIASRGAMTGDVYASVTSQVDALTASLDAAAKNDARWTDVTKDVVANIFTLGNANEDTSQKMDAAAARADATKKAISDLGLTNAEVARIVAGGTGQFATMESELRQMGEGGQAAADHLSTMRVEFLRQRDLATRMVPGISELSSAISTMGDDSASASDKLSALKSAMDAMNPARNQAEATAQYGEAVRKVADAAQGIDASAFNGNQLNAMSEAGATLSRTLTDLANKSAQFVTSGGDMRVVNQKNEQAFQQLAQATGKSVAEIRALYDQLGGNTVGLTVQLAGESDVVQQMGAVKAAFDAQPEKKTISFTSDQITEQTEATLTRLGYTVERIPGTREVRVTMTGDAQARVGALIAQVAQVPAGKAIQTTAPGGQGVLGLLQAMGAQVRVDNNKNIEVVAPLAQNVIDQLAQIGIQVRTDNGKTVLVKADDANFQAAIANATKTETKTIEVRAAVESYNQSLSNLGFGQNRVQVGPDGKPHVAPRADGAIVAYAAGGISDLEAYANGAGLRTMAKPTRADIYAGRGAGTIFAEEETGGEAYIPLAQGKRGRSTDILAAVAKMFGFDLLPQGVLPDSVSGLVGGVAGGALSKLLKATGVDGVRRFADGGVSGAALRALAEGRGASRPLTGAPYVLGGVNWGDCSGAMSAFARLAAGLDPFGGRFATANEGEYLAKLGAKSGLKSGTMQFGWYNGGPGGGHTAGTLPDGTNVEMGGGNGGGMLGGSVGASDPQFTNHAYMEVKDSGRYDGGGTDSPTGIGGQQTNPDAAYSSGYTFDPLSSDDTSSGDTSISGSVGSAFGAFITGQLQDVFSVLSMNDQPGWLAAIVEYEKQHSEDAKKNYDAEKKKLDEDFKQAEDQRKADYDAAKSAIDQDYQSQLISSAERDNRLLALKNGYETDELGHRHDYENSVIRMGQKYGQVDQDSVGSLSLKQRYENDQLRRSQGLQADQYARETQFDREKRSLENLRESKSISQDEYQRRLGALRQKYDADIRGMRTRYNQGDAIAKTTFDQQQSIYAPKDRYNPSGVTTEQYHPSDPGTNSRGNAGDPDTSISGRVTSTGNQIKDAFKSGLREAWRDGQPWTDTDWIITKESNWNPTATNPSSGAFGLPQFLGATKDKYLPDSSPDPKVQGSAYDRYVGDRYQTPMGARAHWEANNWYDSGGVGIGTGLMAKNVLRPERVLSPRQTEAFEQMVNRNFQSGIGTDQIIAKLDQLIAAVARIGAGGVTVNGGIHGMSPEGTQRRIQDIQRRQMMRASQ